MSREAFAVAVLYVLVLALLIKGAVDRQAMLSQLPQVRAQVKAHNLAVVQAQIRMSQQPQREVHVKQPYVAPEFEPGSIWF